MSYFNHTGGNADKISAVKKMQNARSLPSKNLNPNAYKSKAELIKEIKPAYNPETAFWPYYLSEHSSATNRAFHLIGNSYGIICLVHAYRVQEIPWLFMAFLGGYALCWCGHFFWEKNKPTSLRFPFKAFIADWRMYFTILFGNIEREFNKFGIENRR